jgi:hypothetical protein
MGFLKFPKKIFRGFAIEFTAGFDLGQSMLT